MTGIAIAPKIKSEPINAVYDRGVLKPLLADEIGMMPHPIGYYPNRIIQGKFGSHTLFFTGPCALPIIGDHLSDENGMTYITVSINRTNLPEVALTIMDLDQSQTNPTGPRSRRRGLFPRPRQIGKIYVTTARYYHG